MVHSKAKTLKQLKALKDNEIIDNKLSHYLKPTNSLPSTFDDQLKKHKPGHPIHPNYFIKGLPIVQS